MTATSEAAPRPSSRRLHRRVWFVAIATLVLASVGVVMVVEVADTAAGAAPLSTHGGGWLPPDSVHARFRPADASGVVVSTSVIPLRIGRYQGFELTLINGSSATQTVLGLSTAVNNLDDRLLISSTSTAEGNPRAAHYRPPPVSIAPGGVYTARLFHRPTGSWGCGRSETYTSLSLHVRVDGDTRNETIPFREFALEISKLCP